MKTIQSINIKIDELNKVAMEFGDELKSKNEKLNRAEKKAGKELQFLTWCRNLLETNPSEEFLQSEVKRLDNFVKSKTAEYTYWSKNVADKSIDPKNLKTTFNKEMGINKAKKQIKIINYLLLNT